MSVHNEQHSVSAQLLFAEFSMHLLGIKPHAVHVGFVVDEVQLGSFSERTLASFTNYLPTFVPSSLSVGRAMGKVSVAAHIFTENKIYRQFTASHVSQFIMQ